MALKFCRRHRLEFQAGQPEDSRSGGWDEGRRGLRPVCRPRRRKYKTFAKRVQAFADSCA